MKKFILLLLAASLILNIVLIIKKPRVVYKIVERPEKIEIPPYHEIYSLGKSSLHALTPVGKKDVVFFGTSLTEGFPVCEWFGAKNRGIGWNTSSDLLKRVDNIK